MSSKDFTHCGKHQVGGRMVVGCLKAFGSIDDRFDFPGFRFISPFAVMDNRTTLFLHIGYLPSLSVLHQRPLIGNLASRFGIKRCLLQNDLPFIISRTAVTENF